MGDWLTWVWCNTGDSGVDKTVKKRSLSPTLNNNCLISENTIFPNYIYVEQANAYRLKLDCENDIIEIYDFDKFDYVVKKSITLSGASIIPPKKRIALRATDYIELTSGFEVPEIHQLQLGAEAKEVCFLVLSNEKKEYKGKVVIN
jgi:hypothetical protein